MSLQFQTSLRQGRGDIHAIFRASLFIRCFVEGVAGGGLC